MARHLRRAIAAAALLAAVAPLRAQDATPRVAAILSVDLPEYETMVRVLRERLAKESRPPELALWRMEGRGHKEEASRRLLSRTLEGHPDLIVTVGVEATYLLLANRGDVPVFFTHLPDFLAQTLLRDQKERRWAHVGGLSLGDHACAVKTFETLTDLLPPEKRAIGILVSRFNRDLPGKLRSARPDLPLVEEGINSTEEAAPALRRLVEERSVRVLLLPKDPVVSHPEIRRRALEIATGEHHVPVVSIHQSDLRAGALAVMDVDPEEFARTAADRILGILVERDRPAMRPIEGPPEALCAGRLSSKIRRTLGLPEPPAGSRWRPDEGEEPR